MVEYTAAIQHGRAARARPVVEAGKLCGIVSIGDVVKNRLDELELETSILRENLIAGH